MCSSDLPDPSESRLSAGATRLASRSANNAERPLKRAYTLPIEEYEARAIDSMVRAEWPARTSSLSAASLMNSEVWFLRLPIVSLPSLILADNEASLIPLCGKGLSLIRALPRPCGQCLWKSTTPGVTVVTFLRGRGSTRKR